MIEQMTVKAIPVAKIKIDESFNCRRGQINPSTLYELAENIKTNSLIQPIIVRPYRNHFEPEYDYILVAGFRRCLAHRDILKWEFINSIIRTDLDDTAACLVNISENMNRLDLNIMEEALALKKLLDSGMQRSRILTQLNKYPRWLDTRLDLLRLPVEVQEVAAMGLIKANDIPDLYNIYTLAGKNELFRVVRHIKELRLNGKADVTALLKPKSDKRVRKRNEINTIMLHLLNTIGEGLHTRVLAWSIGELSDDELFDDIAGFAAIRDIEYVRPSDLLTKKSGLDRLVEEIQPNESSE